MHLFDVFFMVGLFVEWFAFNEIRTNCALWLPCDLRASVNVS